MIEKNVASLVKWFFLLLVLFGVGMVWTLPVFFAVTVIIIMLYGREIASWTGQQITIGWLGVVFLAAFVVSLAIINYGLGFNVQAVYDRMTERSALTLILDPSYFGPRSMELSAALLLALIIAGAYTRSDFRDRYHWLAAIICVITLMCSGINRYMPRDAGLDNLVSSSCARLRNSAKARFGSKTAEVAKELEVNTMVSQLQQELPPKATIVVATNLLEGEEEFHEGLALAQGDEVFVMLEDKQTLFNLPHLRVRLVSNLSVSGYVRVDSLDFDGLESVEPPKIIQAVQPSTDPAVPAAPIQLDIALQEEAPKRSTVTEDIVVATTDEWTTTSVVPYPNEIIEFGPYESAGDVDRLLSQVGGKTITNLNPVEIWDGRFIGRVTCKGSPNLMNEPLRLKLERGEPLPVLVKKIKY